MCKELQHMPGGEIAHGQSVHGLVQLAADEGQKQAEGVAIVLLSQNAAFEVFENHIMKEIPVGT